MSYNDLQWATMIERVIPVVSLMKILEKDKKKKVRGHVCVNVTRLVFCITAHLTMTASLIITLGDTFTV